MHTAMVMSPHADDVAAFCGGTIAKFADQGWKVVIVRITDDAKDSVNLSEKETVMRNAAEFRDAAKVLGVAETVDLGFPTDELIDVPFVKLRERLVYCLRKYRPYAVFSFDPLVVDGNTDHTRVALAVEDAYWLACFDLHHPKHFAEGLSPFSVCERWYFGDEVAKPNYVEDITDTIERKIQALCSHRTMMKNLVNQYRLKLQTWGRRSPIMEQAFDGEIEPLLSQVLRFQSNAVAQKHSLGDEVFAEEFRVQRFDDLEAFFQKHTEKIQDAPESPFRKGLDLE